ncbi:hypothetical protein JTB14_002736 [Gonioctena quinquepunctata]|nr:hypothetical protein JTB14_002736 [Gonioctena quinquepunctata]
MSHYITRPLWEKDNTEEIKMSMSLVEKKLAENLVTVEIEGKRGKKVPVILTPPVKAPIDVLIRHRDECGISIDNK